MALSNLPGTLAVAVIGILTGQIYRSDLANLKFYRIPPSVVRFSTRFLLPLIGSTRPPRRSDRALPDELRIPPNSNSSEQTHNEEVITTARTPATSPGATAQSRVNNDGGTGPGTSVVREWVNELTGRTDRANAGMRVPSEAEIEQLTSMFPNVQREVVVGALQRRFVVSRSSY